ncbi:hypothetical protein PPERSA_03673 [Pseudocohnilembus persalinus]|uniref:Uncharacterized protein n=1 Tax=Pseudocohnilembus persalinus TaxID=266149 RepID=A0A0V0QNZ7_PSEPJ|nr:hypothetical protein PPERSA_03673 [Pseudocohnilembus persalinus]|eukprot:KRX03712.1 hypothetical protein PPERSA_03673 [Pseudocohnilembus persalinus]
MTSGFVKSSVVFEQDGKLQESEYDRKIQANLKGHIPLSKDDQTQQDDIDADKKEMKTFEGKLLNDNGQKGVLYNEEDFDYYQYYGSLHEQQQKEERRTQQELKKLKISIIKIQFTNHALQKNVVIPINDQPQIIIEKDKEEKKEKSLLQKRKLVKLVKQSSSTTNKNSENQSEISGKNEQKQEDLDNIQKKIQKTNSLIGYGDSSSDEEENTNNKQNQEKQKVEKKQDSQKVNSINNLQNIENKKQITTLPKQNVSSLLLGYDSDDSN